MSMTINDEYPTDWFTVKVKDNDSEFVSLKKDNEGWIISGDKLENVHVYANNKYNEAKTEFTTMYDSALVYEIDQNTIGIAIDADSNGTYETTINVSENTSSDTDTDTDKPVSGMKMGDVDGDGKISAKDSMLVQRFVIKLKQLDEVQIKIADVNGDSKITNKDALEILRYTIHMSKNDRIGKIAA